MKIGKQDAPFQSICTSNAETIIVRGHDLVEDLIGSISFTEHMWLLVTGSMPTDVQRRVLDATLVAIAEHGMVPSVQAARMTLAAAPEALQGAVAAGLLGCGSVILGAPESAGVLLQEIVDEQDASQAGIDAAAATVVRRYRADRRAIPGFGHPLHKGTGRSKGFEPLPNIRGEADLDGVARSEKIDMAALDISLRAACWRSIFTAALLAAMRSPSLLSWSARISPILCFT
ncbi:citryl-CoA lyase [Mesorhizobium sp. A556]